VSFIDSTFYGVQRVYLPGLAMLLALVKDPDSQRNEKSYKHCPEQQREQYAKQAITHHAAAHHRAYAAHHATSTECRNEQQDDDRPSQNPTEYLQARPTRSLVASIARHTSFSPYSPSASL
jgi:anti-sigma factor RsiW